MKTIVSVAQDFSRFPAGRVEADGPYSGTLFRKRHLVGVLRSGKAVEVRLDGTLGFGSSFLEEAFGGLVRIEGLSVEDLRERLTLVANEEPTLVAEIWGYIVDAGRAKQP